MGYTQVQTTSYYLGSIQNQDAMQGPELPFQLLPVLGSVETYDLTSYCPDSASTGTAFASGNKTCSGSINVDPSGEKKFETIAEWLKKKYQYKVGIVSSVNVNHATPADFYAHQRSRKNYYEIGEELVNSGFDYFAGGAFILPKGKDGTKKDLNELAKENGYRFFSEPVTVCHEKSIVIPNRLDEKNAMPYRIDSSENDYDLCDYVKNGIECLDNENGFFMMIEGGKIDWACHSNDAATCVNEVISFGNAVQEVLRFYQQHPDETLVIVTADHESGGLSLGYAGTNYETHLEYLSKQKISCASFTQKFISGYQEDETPFEEAMKDVETNFGLTLGGAEKEQYLKLTSEEVDRLKKAYELTLTYGARPQSQLSEQEYVDYGANDPFTMTIAHILGEKAGVKFATYSHSGDCTPMYSCGVGAENFSGTMDNTKVHDNIIELFR